MASPTLTTQVAKSEAIISTSGISFGLSSGGKSMGIGSFSSGADSAWRSNGGNSAIGAAAASESSSLSTLTGQPELTGKVTRIAKNIPTLGPLRFMR